MSSRIFNAVKAGEVSADVLNLQGFAIGNGLTQPAIQYGAYAPFSLDNKLISQELADDIEKSQYPECKAQIEACTGTTPGRCIDALDGCQNIVGEILEAAGNINVYDIRKQCTVRPFPTHPPSSGAIAGGRPGRALRCLRAYAAGPRTPLIGASRARPRAAGAPAVLRCAFPSARVRGCPCVRR